MYSIQKKNASHSTRGVAVVLFSAKSLYTIVTEINAVHVTPPETYVDAIQQVVLNNVSVLIGDISTICLGTWDKITSGSAATIFVAPVLMVRLLGTQILT